MRISREIGTYKRTQYARFVMATVTMKLSKTRAYSWRVVRNRQDFVKKVLEAIHEELSVNK